MLSWPGWKHHLNQTDGRARPGAYAADLITEEQRFDLVRHSCPGPGACGGMYTANTMASAIEALGMSLPYSSSTPATDPLKKLECRKAGLCAHPAHPANSSAVACLSRCSPPTGFLAPVLGILACREGLRLSARVGRLSSNYCAS